MIARKMLSLVFLAAWIFSLSGCSQSNDEPSAASQSEAGEVEDLPEADVTGAMAEILAKADALDGQADKVVTRCASCALGMDGLAEHPLHVGQYTMHFCKDACKQSFGEDVSKSVLAMEVPEADSGDAH